MTGQRRTQLERHHSAHLRASSDCSVAFHTSRRPHREGVEADRVCHNHECRPVRRCSRRQWQHRGRSCLPVWTRRRTRRSQGASHLQMWKRARCSLRTRTPPCRQTRGLTPGGRCATTGTWRRVGARDVPSLIHAKTRSRRASAATQPHDGSVVVCRASCSATKGRRPTNVWRIRAATGIRFAYWI
jgi:hypothetical protein